MASMTSQLAALILPLRSLFEPLLDRISSLEALEYLFYRYGWRVSLDDTAFAAISDALRAKTALEDLVAIAGPLQEKLDTDAALTGDDVASLARALDALVQAVGHFEVATTAGLPPPLNDAAFWQSIAEHLFDDLLEEYLRIYHPAYYLVLHAAGVIDYRVTAADAAFRQSYTRIVFDWRQIGALIEDPTGALKKTYQWGLSDKPFDHARAIAVVERSARCTGGWIDAAGVDAALCRRPRRIASSRRRRAADHADSGVLGKIACATARTGAAARREETSRLRRDDPRTQVRAAPWKHTARRAAAGVEGRAQSRQRAGRRGSRRPASRVRRWARASRSRIHARRRRTPATRTSRLESAIRRCGSPSRALPTIRKCACGSAQAAQTVSQARARSCRWTRPTVS
jgi:hypothetical protein